MSGKLTADVLLQDEFKAAANQKASAFPWVRLLQRESLMQSLRSRLISLIVLLCVSASAAGALMVGLFYQSRHKSSSWHGIAAAIFGVVSVLVIADLTKGTGRFNLTLGAVTTAVGIGAALSQSIAGGIVHQFGYHAGFLFLAAVAAAAFILLWIAMPETRNFLNRRA